jgi:hypothetical protein
MPKDSQPDNKKARKEKADNKTPITRENQNQNRNAKKQSVEHNDVLSGTPAFEQYRAGNS